MKKISLVGFFLGIVLFPSLSFAAWWNPLSWFSTSVPVEPIVSVEKPLSVPEAPSVKPEIIEKIIEKPVIKTITVQDPALQAQINELISENISLKEHIQNLTGQNKILTDKLAVAEAEAEAESLPSEQCIEAKEDVVAFNKKLATAQENYYEEREKISSGSGLVTGTQMSIQSLTNKFTEEKNLITQSIILAQSEVQLYCD